MRHVSLRLHATCLFNYQALSELSFLTTRLRSSLRTSLCLWMSGFEAGKLPSFCLDSPFSV